MTQFRKLAAAVLAAGVLLTACSGGGSERPAIGNPLPTTPPPSTSAPVAPVTAAPPTTTPPSTGGALPRCTTAELQGAIVGTDGAAGSVYQTLALTNVGDRACELTGFPGVSYVTGDSGEQVGPAAAMEGDRGGPVRLAPDASAVATVRAVQVGAYDPAVCRPTPTRGLRVYPPGDTASLFVPLEGTGCAGTPPGNQLTVTTLTSR